MVYNEHMPFLQPSSSITYLELLPGMRVADFGCGSGHWALLLAQAVGPSGKVFAIDVQETALSATRSQAKNARLENIETIRADLEIPGASHLKDAAVDAVLISNMLFQADEKANVAAEAARIVKPNGRVFLIEWDEVEGGAGPSASQRIPRQTAEHMFESFGFRFEKEFVAGSHHYGLIFRK